jgi:hypothetical protein
LCVAVDTKGNALTSTDPTGGTRSWKITHVDDAVLWDVSCPSGKLCVAVDDGGNVLSSAVPSGGAGAWKSTHVVGASHLMQVSCPSTSLCVAADRSGNVVASTDPGVGAWAVTSVDPADQLWALSCPSNALCVAGDVQGRLLEGRGAGLGVSRNAGITALRSALRHSCNGHRIAQVLAGQGCQIPLAAPGPGTVAVTWLGARGAQIAAGVATTPQRGKLTIRLRLTATGKRQLSNATHNVRVTLEATFADASGQIVAQSATTTLTR